MNRVQRVRILILDPSKGVRNSLREMLLYEGFDVDAHETLEEGYDACQEQTYDLLLIDGDLGEQHVASMRFGKFGKASPIILAANPSIRHAVHAMRDGAWDFIPKPVDMNILLAAIRGVLDMREAEALYAGEMYDQSQATHQNTSINAAPQGEEVICGNDENGIIGSSRSINHVKVMIDKVGPKDTWVLITGPNGVGKELVAKSLHQKSTRASGPFVEVNCAAIPSELIESELFGHEKGAFTSAVKQRKGKFEQADGGTLFLDEIGDMSLPAQAKVLRVLQEHKISRVGGDHDIDVDVRVVSATNKNLPEEIDAGRFREDLYHRLSVIEIHVPPLSDRLGDIPMLANHFARRICNEQNIPCKEIDQQAMEMLQNRMWRGNIRELRNVVERLIVFSEDRITAEDVMTYVICPEKAKVKA